jgi:hypothetical protein
MFYDSVYFSLKMDNIAMDILEGKCVINDIPREHRSHAVCLAQLARYCYDISWLPEEHRTSELYTISVRCSVATTVIRWIPEKSLTYDICFEAVSRSGDNLEYVPEKYRDADMCLKAVSKRGNVLHLVPVELRTVEICKEVARAGYKLTYTPEHFKEEVYAYAASCMSYGILSIPEKERTKEHYLLAYKSGFYIEDIPSEYISDEMRNVASA